MVILTATEIETRFWSHVDKSNECWLWALSLNHGYGQIWINGKRWIASRLAWVLTHGPIEPANQIVCHACDTPACVRPSHLFLGYDRDNLADMRQKGRAFAPPILLGKKNHKAKLSEDEVREIRLRYSRGDSLRTLGRIYGVEHPTISQIVNRKTWVHIT